MGPWSFSAKHFRSIVGPVNGEIFDVPESLNSARKGGVGGVGEWVGGGEVQGHTNDIQIQ